LPAVQEDFFGYTGRPFIGVPRPNISKNGLVFGERSSVVVDPSEEKIKSEFKGVKRTYLPLHSIIRIDEVDKQGTSKISKLEGGNVAQFPVPIYTPGSE
jgi:hypothetical protein